MDLLPLDAFCWWPELHPLPCQVFSVFQVKSGISIESFGNSTLTRRGEGGGTVWPKGTSRDRDVLSKFIGMSNQFAHVCVWSLWYVMDHWTALVSICFDVLQSRCKTRRVEETIGCSLGELEYVSE